MAQLPVESAPAVMPQMMARGKFHGAMIAATPRGSRHIALVSPRGECIGTGWARRSASRA